VKIAVWHNLPSGGGKRALHDHVKGLLQRGHIVEAWCPPTADRTFLPLCSLIREHVVSLDPAPRTIGRVLGNTYATTTAQLAAMDQHCARCATEIGRGGFDVLFVGSCRLFRTSPIARYANLPSAIYLQEPFRSLYEATPPLPWLAPESLGRNYEATPKLPWVAPESLGKNDRLIRYLWGRLRDLARIQAHRIQMREEIANASQFDLILVNSFFSRESVLRAYGLDATVCYLGVDTNHFKPSGEASERFVLGFGSLIYAKGPDRAIKALGYIPESKRPELVWIGSFAEPEYELELRRIANKSGVRLTLKIGVTDSEIRSLLSRAAMLIYTSRLEPFGLSPLEANACGTPVVAIAEGGVRETVQHQINGLLVENADPRSLALAIERLLDDPVLARELRVGSLAHVRTKWPITAAIDRLESALCELAMRKRAFPRQMRAA
jgi:glycosyltransferase involved in cell wall biosynthesis